VRREPPQGPASTIAIATNTPLAYIHEPHNPTAPRPRHTHRRQPPAMNTRPHRTTLLTLTGSLGCLLLANESEQAVWIAASDGEQLTLELPAESEPPLRPGRAILVSLEAISPRGVVRMLGEARLIDRGTIRFRVADVLEVHQRRSYVRFSVSRPIILDTRQGDTPIASIALDLGGGGLLVAGPDHLELGTRVWFRLRLERDGSPIEGHGRVVRIDGHGRRGIAFDTISETDRDRVISYIFDRERSARRATTDV